MDAHRRLQTNEAPLSLMHSLFNILATHHFVLRVGYKAEGNGFIQTQAAQGPVPTDAEIAFIPSAPMVHQVALPPFDHHTAQGDEPEEGQRHGGIGVCARGMRNPIANLLRKAPIMAVLLSGWSRGIINNTSMTPKAMPAVTPNATGLM